MKTTNDNINRNSNKLLLSLSPKHTQATMGIKGLAKLLSDEAPDCIRDVSCM